MKSELDDVILKYAFESDHRCHLCSVAAHCLDNLVVSKNALTLGSFADQIWALWLLESIEEWADWVVHLTGMIIEQSAGNNLNSIPYLGGLLDKIRMLVSAEDIHQGKDALHDFLVEFKRYSDFEPSINWLEDLFVKPDLMDLFPPLQIQRRNRIRGCPTPEKKEIIAKFRGFRSSAFHAEDFVYAPEPPVLSAFRANDEVITAQDIACMREERARRERSWKGKLDALKLKIWRVFHK